jgi:AraC-like DNA-binding protein
MFAVDSTRPFELVGGVGRYRAAIVVLPSAAIKSGSSKIALDPQNLRAHRLHDLLCANISYIGWRAEKAEQIEISILTGVIECLFFLMARQECPEYFDDWNYEIFLLVGLEMDRNLGDPEFGLDMLSVKLGVSRRYVQRVLARHDLTFSTFLREKRMNFARSKLAGSRCKIEEIAAASGYLETSAFYRAFKREFGYAPGAERRQTRGSVAAARVLLPPD